MAAQPAIVFDDVRKHYRAGYRPTGIREAASSAVAGLFRPGRKSETKVVRALDGISFALEKGRALGIVGPNGSGKTTILKLLAKITYPTSGTIGATGSVAALIELGAGFHPDLSGRENLFLNAAILGITLREARRRFDDIVAFAELERFIDTPVKRYSSGMYVRLAFAVAAHVEPEILLVDEVLVVGDARFQQKCIRRIEELRRGGTTILFVSHNMNLMRAVCDEGIFLLNGRIARRGGIVDAIRHYEEHIRQADLQSVTTLNLTHFGQCDPAGGIQVRSVVRVGETEGPVAHSDSLDFNIEITSDQRIEAPRLLARIIRSDGITCCEYRSSWEDRVLPDLVGAMRLRLCFDPVQLASGLYLLEVRLQDRSDAISLVAGQSEWFGVRGPGVAANYQYSGVFVPKVRLSYEFPCD